MNVYHKVYVDEKEGERMYLCGFDIWYKDNKPRYRDDEDKLCGCTGVTSFWLLNNEKIIGVRGKEYDKIYGAWHEGFSFIVAEEK